jgi:hypothetical protein
MLIADRRVEITDETQFDESLGPAVVGAQVEVTALPQPNQVLVAQLIRVVSSVVERESFTDVINEMGSGQWLIGNRWVQVTGATTIIGEPAVGKVAQVDVERVPGQPWTATRIEIEEEERYYIEGEITAISASAWVVDGRTIAVTDDTDIGGLPPQVGLWAEVQAVERNGQLIALSIVVIEPPVTPAPTVTPTVTPTELPATETPTATPTATPSATPVELPSTETPTATPTATPTDSPEPPQPTATPAATATPTPDSGG